MDGTEYWSVENRKARRLEDVSIHLGDSQYHPNIGKVKNLKVETTDVWNEDCSDFSEPVLKCPKYSKPFPSGPVKWCPGPGMPNPNLTC